MRDRILVINPNSTEAVTRGIDEAMAPLRFPGAPEIHCVTLAEGPRMMTNIVGCPQTPEALVLDMPLEVTFAPQDAAISLPLFKPAGA